MAEDPFKIVVLASGRGSNFQALAKHLASLEDQIAISALITDKAKAGAIEHAKARNIPHHIISRRAKERSNEEFFSEITEVVEQYQPDLVVLAGFMRIISRSFIKKFENRIINIHPSLLPSFKGLKAQEQALKAGVHFAGCTVHMVVEEIDSGAILGQAVVPVLVDDTEEKLTARILTEEHKLLPRVVEAIVGKEITIDPQGNVKFGNCRIANESATVSINVK